MTTLPPITPRFMPTSSAENLSRKNTTETDSEHTIQTGRRGAQRQISNKSIPVETSSKWSRSRNHTYVSSKISPVLSRRTNRSISDLYNMPDNHIPKLVRVLSEGPLSYEASSSKKIPALNGTFKSANDLSNSKPPESNRVVKDSGTSTLGRNNNATDGGSRTIRHQVSKLSITRKTSDQQKKSTVKFSSSPSQDPAGEEETPEGEEPLPPETQERITHWLSTTTEADAVTEAIIVEPKPRQTDAIINIVYQGD